MRLSGISGDHGAPAVTLSEFLLARIAEDEATAREACAFGHWAATMGWISDGPDSGVWEVGHEVLDEEGSHNEEDPTVRGEHLLIYDEGGHNVAHARHIAQWDPARVLAECEAKRLAIEAAWGDHLKLEDEWGYARHEEQMSAEGDNPDVVEALAWPYADHPDYRQEWAPHDVA